MVCGNVYAEVRGSPRVFVVIVAQLVTQRCDQPGVQVSIPVKPSFTAEEIPSGPEPSSELPYAPSFFFIESASVASRERHQFGCFAERLHRFPELVTAKGLGSLREYSRDVSIRPGRSTRHDINDLA